MYVYKLFDICTQKQIDEKASTFSFMPFSLVKFTLTDIQIIWLDGCVMCMLCHSPACKDFTKLYAQRT